MKLILQGTAFPDIPDVWGFDMDLEYDALLIYHESEWWDETEPPYWREAQVVGY
jgi:hypothetical protein